MFSASFAYFHVAVEQQLGEVDQYENCTNFNGYLVTQVDSSVCYSRMMVCWRQMDWHASGGNRLGIFDVIKESQKSRCLWSCLYWQQEIQVALYSLIHVILFYIATDLRKVIKKILAQSCPEFWGEGYAVQLA